MLEKNIEAIYPLSPVQQAMLFHTLAEPESAPYYSQLSCHLQGNLNVLAFREAWQQVLNRHSILRTAFVWEGVTQPVQVVGRQVKLPFEEHDWAALPVPEQQDRLAAFLKGDRSKGFTLSRGPLLRLTLFRLSDSDYQLVWSVHHLILDGWSWPIVIQDMLLFYEASSRGQVKTLPTVRPYADYIAWFLKQDASAAEGYWRKALTGLTGPTQLGTPAPALGPEEIYITTLHTYPARLLLRLQSIAKHYQLTLNTVLLGAWALLLSRYSGEKDIVFGVTSAGRPTELKGVEEMVGVFINTLPLRVIVPDEPAVVLWLKQLQARQVEMRQYEFTPLTQVQGWADVPRGLPLFESLFVFQNYPIDTSKPTDSGSLKVSIDSAIENTNFPITVVSSVSGELTSKIVYDGRQFDSGTIARIFGHLQSLLEQIEAGPEKTVASLTLLSEAEQQQLLTAWNATSVGDSKDARFTDLFLAQVLRTPDAVAVAAEDRQLTYRELNDQANLVASALRSAGIGPEGRVGILLDRGLEMIVAILAVLKSGAAYAPLDPAHPEERLRFILRDSSPSVILTTSQFRIKVPECDALIIRIGSDQEALAGTSQMSSQCPRPDGSLMYVIYTSGSTGSPKGAMVEQRGVVNHLSAKICDLQLNGADVIAQTASQSFDISVWQFLAALLVGGRVEVFDDKTAHDPSSLLAKIRQKGVTIWETVPAILRSGLEEIRTRGGECVSSLRWLVVTGENLAADLCRSWFTACPTIPLMNAYGPTECSDDVTHYGVFSAPAEKVVNIPIGRPIRNTRVHILDDQLRPVPIGVRGQLHIAGASVGRGYWSRPESTATAFIPNPFSVAPGERLYRTGDIARYGSDGAIEYLGRVDHQLKIRGFRIESGEIERMLTRHPAIAEALIVGTDLGREEKLLIAYIVPKRRPYPSSTELKIFLKKSLPDYMVPSVLIPLEQMPTTTNGKIDRRALPTPDPQVLQEKQRYLAPETDIEKTQTVIWTEVLKVQQIGIADNFFDLGGHSLNATQLVSRLRMKFGVDLTLAEFFASPTIKDVSTQIEMALIKQTSAEDLDALIVRLGS